MKLSVVQSLAVTVFSFGLIHCGGDPVPDGGTNNEGGVVQDGGATGDVPVIEDTGIIPDGGNPLVPAKSGSVLLTAIQATVRMMTLNTSTVAGGFTSTASMGGTTQTMGDCKITTPGAMPGRAVGAGTITVSGGAGMPLTLMAGPNAAYASTDMTERFPANSMLTIAAAGDPIGVPAFSGMVTMPGPVGLTMPMLSPTMALNIPRAMPLVLTWSGGGAGKVEVLIAKASFPTIQCTFNAAGATGTIPAAALMMYPANTTARMLFGASNQTTVTAGEYNITLSALRVTGVAATGEVTLQ